MPAAVPPTVRFAGPGDAPALHGFIVALAEYEHEPDAVEATPASLAAQLASDRPPFEALLAERGGLAVGFALFFQTYSTWTGRPGLWLEDLFVPPEHRRQGVGTALLRALARLSVERGYGRMEWAVLDWNAPAIAFYRSLGAVAMDAWTTNRITGSALAALARG